MNETSSFLAVFYEADRNQGRNTKSRGEALIKIHLS